MQGKKNPPCSVIPTLRSGQALNLFQDPEVKMLKYIQHDGDNIISQLIEKKSTQGRVDELFAICHHQNAIFSLLLSQEQEFLILNT